MTLRKANYSDIETIVSIHVASFRDFFLTSLGRSFLKTYYESYLKCPSAVLLCAIENDSTVGFAAAAINSRSFNKKLIIHNLFNYLWQAIRLSFTRPSVILRLIKNIEKKSASVDDSGDYSELFSIAVSPNFQNRGIGKQLLVRVEDIAKESGAQRLSLTTDYYNNAKALNFYKTYGFQVFYDFTSYPNRRMFRLIKDI